MDKALKNELRAYFSVLFHIVIFTFVIVTTTVVVHEYGHYFAGNAMGCGDVEIVLLDENFETYTKMNCNNLSEGMSAVLSLSGFLFISPFALALFLLSRYEKYHSFVVFGFNMIISSSDLAFSGAGALSVLAGSVLILYGENLLVSRYISLVEGELVSSSSK
jgi:hypothetical protein